MLKRLEESFESVNKEQAQKHDHMMKFFYSYKLKFRALKDLINGLTYQQTSLLQTLQQSTGKTCTNRDKQALHIYAHFMFLAHLYSAIIVIVVFMDNVYKLYGMPTDIVNGRGIIFIGQLRKNLFVYQRVNSFYSTTCHP